MRSKPLERFALCDANKASIADTMTGRAHRPNTELVGQGVANMAAAVFGGICVTGRQSASNVMKPIAV
jgi:MFS superfamily sulfate permease-like transporter